MSSAPEIVALVHLELAAPGFLELMTLSPATATQRSADGQEISLSPGGISGDLGVGTDTFALRHLGLIASGLVEL